MERRINFKGWEVGEKPWKKREKEQKNQTVVNRIQCPRKQGKKKSQEPGSQQLQALQRMERKKATVFRERQVLAYL